MKSERLLESAHEVVILRAMADEQVVGVCLWHRHYFPLRPQRNLPNAIILNLRHRPGQHVAIYVNLRVKMKNLFELFRLLLSLERDSATLLTSQRGVVIILKTAFIDNSQSHPSVGVRSARAFRRGSLCSVTRRGVGVRVYPAILLPPFHQTRQPR